MCSTKGSALPGSYVTGQALGPNIAASVSRGHSGLRRNRARSHVPTGQPIYVGMENFCICGTYRVLRMGIIQGRLGSMYSTD